MSEPDIRFIAEQQRRVRDEMRHIREEQLHILGRLVFAEDMLATIKSQPKEHAMPDNAVTAIDIAREAKVTPRRLRRALRAANPPWHEKGTWWKADRGSEEEQFMRRVAATIG